MRARRAHEPGPRGAPTAPNRPAAAVQFIANAAAGGSPARGRGAGSEAEPVSESVPLSPDGKKSVLSIRFGGIGDAQTEADAKHARKI